MPARALHGGPPAKTVPIVAGPPAEREPGEHALRRAFSRLRLGEAVDHGLTRICRHPAMVLLPARRVNDDVRMEQRVSLVTLGVADLARARAFYEALGWRTGADPGDDVAFFQAAGMVVALWSRASLAEDSGVEDSGGWGGVTLAHNVRSPAEVDAVLDEARRAGARIAREGAETFWGGYSGVFVDPDGHPWEVAHNPHWQLADDGSVKLP